MTQAKPIEASDEMREVVLSRIEVDEAGCWIWQGCIAAGHGYGLYWYKGIRAKAHRVSYTVFVGPVPDDLVLDHLCRVRACVNPSHLEAVTHRENFLRGDNRTAVIARSGACAQGHERTPENATSDGRSCRLCVNAWRRRKYREARDLDLATNSALWR